MELKEILKNTFKNSLIPEDISDLKMGDFDEWDSLGNFNLILAVEQHFQVQFEIDDLENLTSIKAIQMRINDALSAK